MKKQIKDKGENIETFPTARLPELINWCIENTVYNPDLKRRLKVKLFNKLEIPIPDTPVLNI